MTSRPFSLAFSTMGDPSLSFEQACALLDRHGLDAFELRTLEGSLDLPDYFQKRGLPKERRTCVVATSLALLHATPQSVAEFYQYARLAHELGAPYVRVFGAGGGDFSPAPERQQLKTAATLVNELRETLRSNGWNVKLLLETHDVLSASDRCVAFNAHLDEPLAILWDSHHTWRMAGESLESSWAALGPFIEHIHYKDSVSDSTQREGYRYVSPGAGEFPAQQLRQLLVQANYRGGVSLEWEKLWHNYLGPLDDALGAFAHLFKEA